MKRLPLLLLPALLLTQIACVWDRDTLASELAGRGDAVKIIGKEPRFPAIPLSIRASDFFFGSFIGIITLAILPFILLYIISKIIQISRAKAS